MTIQTVAINGVNIEEMGMKAINLDGWLSAPARSMESVDLLERAGAVPSSQTLKYAPVPLQLGVTTYEDGTPASARAVANRWIQFLQGELEIEIADAPGVVRYGYFLSSTGDTLGIALIDDSYRIMGQVLCFDPTWYLRYPQDVLAGAGVRIQVPMGSTQGQTRVQIMGPTTTLPLTLTLRNRAGIALGEMKMAVQLGATEVLEIDMDNNTMVKYTAGVPETDTLDDLDDYDTFLELSADDGPTLEVNDGTLRVLHWMGALT